MTAAATRTMSEPMTLLALVEEIDFLAERVESGDELTDAQWLRLLALWEAMKISLEAREDGSGTTACDD
jgi:hypothetical protein